MVIRSNKKEKWMLNNRFYTALDAFNKNAYFLLFDNIQAESLETNDNDQQ
jgi:hypothetical protein